MQEDIKIVYKITKDISRRLQLQMVPLRKTVVMTSNILITH